MTRMHRIEALIEAQTRIDEAMAALCRVTIIAIGPDTLDDLESASKRIDRALKVEWEHVRRAAPFVA